MSTISSDKKWLVFDLDQTLIDFEQKLLIKSDVLAILEELHRSEEYELAIASFNDSATEILEELGLRHLFSVISSGIKENDGTHHKYSFSKIDNLLEVMCWGQIQNSNQMVFLDDNVVNCNHAINHLKIPSIIINNISGVSIQDIYLALDILDGKTT